MFRYDMNRDDKGEMRNAVPLEFGDGANSSQDEKMRARLFSQITTRGNLSLATFI